MGLNMNITKTIVIVIDNTPIITNNVLIENVEGYEYTGQHYSIKEKTQYKEIQRIIMTGSEAYANNQNLFKSNLVILPEETIFNSCVLPALTGADTWIFTKQAPDIPKWKEVC